MHVLNHNLNTSHDEDVSTEEATKNVNNSNKFSNLLIINETPKSSKISSIFNPEKILNSVVKLKASFYTFFATCIQNFKVSETLKSSTTKTSTPCSYVPN